MVLVTGDIHGCADIGKLTAKANPIQKEMTKEDFLIIAGDFGLVWNNDEEDLWWRKWLDKKPYTTLFVDGNHENFDLLDDYEVTEFNGGKVHRIGESIYHLMRGEMFELQGKRFFTMGGAESHDKEFRTLGTSIWTQEMPSDEEYIHAIETLDRIGWQTDFVITHCAPTPIQSEIAAMLGFPDVYPSNRLTDFLQQVREKLEFRGWFHGHYHTDLTSTIDPRVNLLFNNILQIV
ncbi:metallophosphoesterase family protein [Ruminococcus albus]|uniref:Ser/Thr phosphatase family protein n=1 Tax=Ruminococcus albus 8 TaxID=246199 RepID=E9SC31_RUMAL|nr:metallophosphoesterase [Ruminococcus albus]EGC03213.1 Ser/Thr phosphatase family protein [Ruminococcus albus 8]MCC3351959.1 metallophosphatase family protein [Ruminococcus albus 8]